MEHCIYFYIKVNMRLRIEISSSDCIMEYKNTLFFRLLFEGVSGVKQKLATI